MGKSSGQKSITARLREALKMRKSGKMPGKRTAAPNSENSGDFEVKRRKKTRKITGEGK